MRYFFILGSNPAVSAAEILSLVHGEALTVAEIHKQALIIETQHELDTADLMDRLGGTIKIGRLTEHFLPIDGDKLAKFMADTLAQGDTEGKIKFGYSIYALEGPKPGEVAARAAGKLRKVGMETKRLLKESGLSVRWVRPQAGPALTSVVVEKDNLLKSGGEFVILVKGGNMYIGLTDVVQPFELFSQIDYGRPKRDTYRGMLPPKLARIMLNIANTRAGSTVWDPFCGSGTVVTEAMRLGVQKVYGSDLSEDAVKKKKKNIAWLQEKELVSGPFETTIFQHDAREGTDKIQASSIDAIVAEPFLGKPQRGGEKKSELLERLDELTGLYRDALESWKPLLADGGAVVLALPLYIVGLNRIGIDATKILGDDYEIESLVPQTLADRMGLSETKNRGVTYGRIDQRVWREIVRLRLK